MHILNVCHILIVLFNCALGANLEDFQSWQKLVTNDKYKCPAPQNDEIFSEKPTLLFQIVDCNEHNAIFRYDFKQLNGKKPKKGPFNGRAKILIATEGDNENYNFGFKNKKCVQVYSKMARSISGTFVNDVLEGEVTLKFSDDTKMETYVKSGYAIGPQRFFTTNGNFLNITDTNTGQIILSETDEKFLAIFACQNEVHDLGPRCVIFQNETFTDSRSCLVVDRDFFVNCYNLSDFKHIEFSGCELSFDTSKEITLPAKNHLFNMRLKSEEKMIKSEMKEKLECSNSLESWLKEIQNPNLLWYHFNEKDVPFDHKNPEIEIELSYLKSRSSHEKLSVKIQTHIGGLILFKGIMYNGKMTGKVDPKFINHPAWRSRLVIQITNPNSINILENHMHNITGSFRNGKLHGLVQIYGKMAVDPKGHCSGVCSEGLSFLGWFEEGKPKGPCFRSLIGGSYLYGIVDEKGEFTGTNDIAFIYQDLELALIGQFDKGIMTYGQESQVIGSTCNEHGIRVLKFSDPVGSVYHYEEPTNVTLGDQPHLRDPLENKYMYIKKSEFNGEGAFAARDLPADLIYANYAGFLYTAEEDRTILTPRLHRKIKEKNWNKDDPEYEKEWTYRIAFNHCQMIIDIPPEYGSTEKFQGSLAHKINHKFDSNSIFAPIESARFGIILSLKTSMPMKKGEELFTHYGYTQTFAPKWYRELYKHYAKENPEKASKESLRVIQEIDDVLEKHQIPLITSNQSKEMFSFPTWG